MKRTTLSVGIPSYNEANTIATVLSTVLCEPLPPGCELVSTVISDCSTDATPEILERFTIARPDFIKVIHHTFRTGLNLAINEIFENANTDFLLYINADSLPAAGSISSLVESMLSDESVGAVSAAMIPVPVGQSFVERAGVFGAGVFQRLRESSRSFHGRMFMIRGKLARKVRLPVDAIEQDAFISCSIREMGFRVEYLRSAICYYSPPSTLRDYVLPNRLYRIGTQTWKQQHPKWEKSGMLRDAASINQNTIKAILGEAASDPSGALVWTFLKIVEKFYPTRDLERRYQSKPVAQSTKVLRSKLRHTSTTSTLSANTAREYPPNQSS